VVQRWVPVVLVLLLVLSACDLFQERPRSGYKGLGAESVSPEVLAKYAPPPLPPEVRRRVQSMLDVRSPGAGIVTLDGSRMFFTWSVTGTAQVWRLDGPKQFPVQLTGGEDPTSLADVMPDGRHVLVSRDRGGEENPGLYLLPVDGGPLEVVAQKDKVRSFLSFVTEDGTSIYYIANDRKPDSYAIYRWDVATRKAELVFDQDGLWSVADDRPGALLLAKETGSTSREFYELDLATKALTPLLGQGEFEDHQAEYGRQPGELIVLTPKFGDFRRLYRYGSGRFTAISPEVPHDVSSFAVEGPRILYEVNEGGYTRARTMDSTTFTEVSLPPLPAADHVGFGATTDNHRFTSLRIDTGRAPPASYVLDWTTGSLGQWHVPSVPEVDTNRFAVATLESYPARDGTRIPMVVRRPPSCSPQPCPVVVHFHGGPEAQSRPGFDSQAQLFVDAGFVLVEPNVRGSEGYGKAWLHADDGPKRMDVITDIEDCARFIRANWGVPRIGAFGGSYGGYSALMAMTFFAGAYEAGASVVGMASLVTFLENTAPYRRALRVTEYGDPTGDRDALLQLSPLTHVGRAKAPLIVIQGANDPRVPVGEAIQIHEALRDKKIDSRLIVFADEGHGTQKRDNRVLELGHVIQFFEKHLARR
jgi:dipeptidyl aminopeptidase/acylaminoacyl peptidase